MSFRSLGLKPELARAVADKGYDEPTPIQREVIPVILEGRDLMAGAQTGTGKTAGFTLPLLQLLQEFAEEREHPSRTRTSSTRPVRALILTPTRELAAQVELSVKTYGRHLPLRSTVVFGGVGIVPQKKALRAGVDIVVATPGRLLDHITQKTVDLSRVEILVLDEADRMLDMGFIRDIRKILAVLPRDRQNLLFSATFSEEIKKLAAGFMHSPAVIQVAVSGIPPELVSQVVHPVDKDRKRQLLSHLIQTGDWKQVLVFTRTKHGANRLAHQLESDGITTLAIHGNKSQGARTKALGDFKRGTIGVLVATDVAARGLDIDQLPHVVNYELPHVPEDYVHRIGRTGRAGNDGTAVSLVSAEEHELLAGIEHLLGRHIKSATIPGFEPNPSARSQPLQRARSGGGKSGPRRGGGKQRGSAPAHPRGEGSRRSAPRRGDGPRRGGDGSRRAEPRGDGQRTRGPESPARGPERHARGPERHARAPERQNRAPERPAGRGSGPAAPDETGRQPRRTPPSRSRRPRGARAR